MKKCVVLIGWLLALFLAGGSLWRSPIQPARSLAW